MSAAASAATADAGASSSVVQETALLSLVRLGFFFACRHYVNASLFSGLKQVIKEDGLADSLDSPDADAIHLSDIESGAGAGGGRKSSLVPSSSLHSSSSLLAPEAGTSIRRGPSPVPSAVSSLYTKLSTALFCLAFSESSVLFTLLLFGDAVSDAARSFNWSLSLLALLSIIVFIIPLGICLLLTHRTRPTAFKTLLLTLIPFAAYLLLFYKLGSFVASKFVVEGSHSIGYVNALLSRVCVPGVFLIASLSGGGAVNTAMEAFEWRSISNSKPPSDDQIITAERALYRARMDLHSRQRSLELAATSAAREAEQAAGQSMLSRWTSSSPAKAHLASLQVEVGALESLESQMSRDVAGLKRRKEMHEMGRTAKGRLWLFAGWLLSVYCTWRVFISCLNLVFGYSRQQPTDLPTLPDADAPVTPATGTDLITSLLGRLALVLNVEIDVATWSRLIGLVAIGSIILANMRNVLSSVSRIFKATSTGVSASFMLLFLAQLMAMYLLTSLISLPSTVTDSAASLLNTLPSFNVFSRLFDSVFLFAAGSVFVTRYIERKMRVVDGSGLAY